MLQSLHFGDPLDFQHEIQIPKIRTTGPMWPSCKLQLGLRALCRCWRYHLIHDRNEPTFSSCGASLGIGYSEQTR